MLFESNHTNSILNSEINLHSWGFQKAQINLAHGIMRFDTFWKTDLCKLIPNWTIEFAWLPFNNKNNKIIVSDIVYTGKTLSCDYL